MTRNSQHSDVAAVIHVRLDVCLCALLRQVCSGISATIENDTCTNTVTTHTGSMSDDALWQYLLLVCVGALCVRVVSFYKSKPYPIGSWYDLPGTAAAVMRMASMLWSVCNCNIFTRARIWASVPVLCMQVSATFTEAQSRSFNTCSLKSGCLVVLQLVNPTVCSTFSFQCCNLQMLRTWRYILEVPGLKLN